MKLNEKKMTAAVIGGYTRSCCRSTKNAFFKALFCRQKRITEKGRPTLGPYDFRDAENADGIAESSHKNGIYSLMQNVTEFVKVWMN